MVYSSYPGNNKYLMYFIFTLVAFGGGGSLVVRMTQCIYVYVYSISSFICLVVGKWHVVILVVSAWLLESGTRT